MLCRTEAGGRFSNVIASTAPSAPDRTAASNDAAPSVAAAPADFCLSASFAAAKYPCSRRKRPIAARMVAN